MTIFTVEHGIVALLSHEAESRSLAARFSDAVNRGVLGVCESCSIRTVHGI